MIGVGDLEISETTNEGVTVRVLSLILIATPDTDNREFIASAVYVLQRALEKDISSQN